MSNNLDNQYGRIIISEEVIEVMVGIAATECYGIVGMASKRLKDGIWELLRKENLSKGISVKTTSEKLQIEIHIIVSYGVKISEVAQNVIDKVKYTLENYTGLEVDEVNVNIQDIRIEQ